MKVKRFVLCLFMLTLIGGICFISCGNTSKAKAESDVAAETAEETFQSFLKKIHLKCFFPVYPCQVSVENSHHLDDGRWE